MGTPFLPRVGEGCCPFTSGSREGGFERSSESLTCDPKLRGAPQTSVCLLPGKSEYRGAGWLFWGPRRRRRGCPGHLPRRGHGAQTVRLSLLEPHAHHVGMGRRETEDAAEPSQGSLPILSKGPGERQL
uniref:Uncharacterized protein n=1 Tax=Pipistrellus kuhlii TaxID=59472 RepID=A0A7J7TVY8_PIPKU|nr:hypothetical protein mPipKuh1_009238 [Pipistrellus kuhlii]